ncbi:MAG TPA: hypothetical protein VHZ78_01080 [Rhizomicrobium sp.]|jgi:hypothetical protein|nr:hypothetical protein [Rhizomicrobium sp.]
MIGIAVFGAFVAILFAAQIGFVRWRRKLAVREQWVQFKRRLPAWVRWTELSVQWVFWIGCALPLINVMAAWHHRLGHALDNDDPGTTLLMIVPVFIGVMVPAMLLANLSSWTIPALRRANRAAMAGLPELSLRRANVELAWMGAALVPYCAAFTVLGVFQPWAGI